MPFRRMEINMRKLNEKTMNKINAGINGHILLTVGTIAEDTFLTVGTIAEDTFLTVGTIAEDTV